MGDVRIIGVGGTVHFDASTDGFRVDAHGTELGEVNISAGGAIVLKGTGGTTFGDSKGVDIEGDSRFTAGTDVRITGTGGTYVYARSHSPIAEESSVEGVSFYDYMPGVPGEYNITTTSGDVTITGTGGVALQYICLIASL